MEVQLLIIIGQVSTHSLEKIPFSFLQHVKLINVCSFSFYIWAVGTMIGVWPKRTGLIGATGRDQVTSVVGKAIKD